MKVTGTNLFMSNFLGPLILILGLSANAQNWDLEEINTFSSGEKIKASEVNENFQILIDEIGNVGGGLDSIIAPVACTNASLSGLWLFVGDDGDQYEVTTVNFNSDGSLDLVYRETGADIIEVEGTYEMDSKCAIEGSVNFSEGMADFYAWLSDDGNSLPTLLYKPFASDWGSGTGVRYNR